jgi:hypothetical protein
MQNMQKNSPAPSGGVEMEELEDFLIKKYNALSLDEKEEGAVLTWIATRLESVLDGIGIPIHICDHVRTNEGDFSCVCVDTTQEISAEVKRNGQQT